MSRPRSDLQSTTDQIDNVDPDLRYMALTDLLTQLNTNERHLSDSLLQKLNERLLRTLEDSNAEV